MSYELLMNIQPMKLVIYNGELCPNVCKYLAIYGEWLELKPSALLISAQREVSYQFHALAALLQLHFQI
jgi:hypothetical protein